MSDEKLPAKTSTNSISAGGAESIQGASNMISGVMREIEGALDTKHVVGEPLTFGTTTVVPLFSYGFGFGAGAGGGGGTQQDGQAGQGGGGGGGGGVKPVAVLIISDDGVRLEPIPEPTSGLERVGEAIAGALKRRSDPSDAD
jgi:uncharacterized spore protein YtfJ